jgi:CRISPR-associated endonuclease/helicase Cas3
MQLSFPPGADRAPRPSAHDDTNPWIFWAKFSKNAGTFHPLLCHLVDVAVVAQAMWRGVLPPRARRRFADALGVDEEAAGRWIAFWAGLHDLGKASPAFQLQTRDSLIEARLRRAGLSCRAADARANPHGTVSAQVLRGLLPQEFGLGAELASRVAIVVGGHHGTFPSSGKIQALSKEAVGRGAWQGARGELSRLLATVLELPHEAPPGDLDHAAEMALAGFVSVADWIGSNEDCFPHAATNADDAPALDLAEYAGATRERADNALRRLGWMGWSPSPDALTFRQLFPNIAEPRAVQSETVELAERLREQSLVIVEAPMGEGKTEAAMYLADRWGSSLGQRGCYFALPTQATSDQMFGRVREFLIARYPDEIVNLQLLHGHAALSAEFQELRQNEDRLFEPEGVWGESGSDGARPNVVAAEWFTWRKRSLLAPFGVGTVDQALLAVLQTRHVFVRLFGLSSKTVIVDEVHAYDTYMTTLLVRLLEWLGALGASVVLLSATLPSGRRQDLIRAYARGAGWSLPEAVDSASYPRLTWATGSGTGARHVDTPSRSEPVEIVWVDGRLPGGGDGRFSLGERLRQALAGGGCAAIICNTVRRAQQVYQALKPYFDGQADDGEPELDLLHARYLFKDRERREGRVLRRFGKGPGARRPRRAVLVSTQIIEQSLDLDFDLMVTDLAPADLVLQRSGRLHRHARPMPRPQGLERPRLWICEPEQLRAGVPGFDRGTEAVYDGYILLRSWLELRERTSIRIPDDVEALVEAVYNDGPCPPDLTDELRREWEETLTAHEAALEHERREAEQRYIKWPGYDGGLSRLVGEPREEEAPELHPAHQALTRLIDVTVPLVCLEGTPERPLLDGEALRKDKVPDVALAKRLLRRSVTVSDRRIVYELLDQPTPDGWIKSPLLRHHRLVALDGHHSARVGKWRLHLDGEVGLVVEPGDDRR